MKYQNKINRNNYEIFFLDYSEGNLSKEDAELLFQFLEENPDLQAEFDLLMSQDLETLMPDKNIVFENADSLKKTEIRTIGNIDATNYETFFIAFFEGDLSEDEQNSVIEFVAQNPSLKVDFEQFEKSVLQPDKKIVFDHKNELKRTKQIPLYHTLYYIAASLVAVFVLFFLFKNMVKEPDNTDNSSFVQIVDDSIQLPSMDIQNIEYQNNTNHQKIEETAIVLEEQNESVHPNKKRSSTESLIISTIEPIPCQSVAFEKAEKPLEYRYEAAQLAQDMEMAKMIRAQQESQQPEKEPNGSNFWTSLFNAAEKTAVATGQLAKN